MDQPIPIDARLRTAASAGDPRAFDELVEPHRTDLHRYCTLMVGCPLQGQHLMRAALADARDALTAGGGVEIAACSSTRIWLHRIATQACLLRLDEREHDR